MVSSIGGNKGSSLLRNLNKAQKDQDTFLERLSSGKRINKAQDDAAGLAIVAALEASSAVSSQAVRNVDDSISAIAIAEGAMGQVTEINTRMEELAMQASNGVLSDAQREPLQAEFNALREELGRISSTTTFNGRSLLSGDNITSQVGGDASADSQITIDAIDMNSITSGIASLDISTEAGAKAALDPLSSLGAEVVSRQGDLGAATARLQVSRENTVQSMISEEEAASRIRDVDVAETSARLTASRILADGGTALVAQANQTAQVVLQLLK